MTTQTESLDKKGIRRLDIITLFGMVIFIIFLFFMFVIYPIYYSIRYGHTSYQAFIVEKFCKENGYDKSIDDTFKFYCQKEIIEDNTKTIITKEVRYDIDLERYFLIEEVSK
jgi:ABC-type sugar transport system permease subunit